ncbi:MAG: hypothetical protein U0133_06080 [Gemmatimonadales bacterium]
MTRPLAVVDLGHLPYADAHQLQRTLCDQRAAGAIDRDLLLLVEHEPTVRWAGGPSRKPAAPPGELARRGLTVVEVERGGDVTWRTGAAGQPTRSSTCSSTSPTCTGFLRPGGGSADPGARRARDPGRAEPGVHRGVDRGREIASIGIHVRRQVTTSFALNVSNDLAGFGAAIVPCGIQGVEMTSVELEAAQSG